MPVTTRAEAKRKGDEKVQFDAKNKERALAHKLVRLDSKTITEVERATRLVRWSECDPTHCSHLESSCGHIPTQLSVRRHDGQTGPCVIGLGTVELFHGRHIPHTEYEVCWSDKYAMWVHLGTSADDPDNRMYLAVLPATITNKEMQLWNDGFGSPFDFDFPMEYLIDKKSE